MIGISQIETALVQYADKVPVEFFVFIGSFVEEVIAPVPSPLILTLTGSIAAFQKYPALYLIVLSVLGAIGKTVGGWLFYVIADKGEDFVLTKFGKFVGISHKEVESIGAKLKDGKSSNFILFALRALPVIPSGPISLVCGLIKFPLKPFLFVSLLGTIIRNLIFIYFGYVGATTFDSLIHGFERAESIIQVVMLVGLAGVIAWIYIQRRKGGMPAWLEKFFKK